MTHHSALSISAVLVLAALLHAKVASAQEKFLRFEVAPLFSAYHAPAGFKSVTDQFELGGRFGWNWFPHLSLEGEYASTLRQPAIRTQDEGGGLQPSAIRGQKRHTVEKLGSVCEIPTGFRKLFKCHHIRQLCGYEQTTYVWTVNRCSL